VYAEIETTWPKRSARVLRESAALYGGPRGGLLSRSHRIRTFWLVTCLLFVLLVLMEHWKRAFVDNL
jgi:hypothetical protein